MHLPKAANIMNAVVSLHINVAKLAPAFNGIFLKVLFKKEAPVFGFTLPKRIYHFQTFKPQPARKARLAQREPFAKLTKWARTSPQLAEQAVAHAIRTIILLAPGEDTGEAGVRITDTAPFNLITSFLCHVIVWAFAKVATCPEKLRFLDTISENREITSTAFFATLQRSFAFEEHGKESSKTIRRGFEGRNGNGEEAVLFRSAADMLTRLGTWGCSLNLALLLHERAKMYE